MFEHDVAAPELLETYSVQSLDGFGFQPSDDTLVRASGALIQYLAEIRPAGVTHLRPVRIRRPGRVMLLDEMTRRQVFGVVILTNLACFLSVFFGADAVAAFFVDGHPTR